MLDFVKKLFGLRPEPPQPVAPYKIEPQLDPSRNTVKVDVGSMPPAQAVVEVKKVQEKVKKERVKKPAKSKEVEVVVSAAPKPKKPRKPKAPKTSA